MCRVSAYLPVGLALEVAPKVRAGLCRLLANLPQQQLATDAITAAITAAVAARINAVIIADITNIVITSVQHDYRGRLLRCRLLRRRLLRQRLLRRRLLLCRLLRRRLLRRRLLIRGKLGLTVLISLAGMLLLLG